LSWLNESVREEKTATAQLSAAKATYKQLEDLKKNSRKTEYELLSADRRAPEDAELPALLIQIEDISQKAGISFQSITPSEPIQKDGFKQVPITIQVNGYFYSLLDFVYRLEKLPRIINVTGIEITEGSLGLPNISVVLSAYAYVMTPGAKDGKESSGIPVIPGATGTTAVENTTSATTGSTP